MHLRQIILKFQYSYHLFIFTDGSSFKKDTREDQTWYIIFKLVESFVQKFHVVVQNRIIYLHA